jgi:hypothetical protein
MKCIVLTLALGLVVVGVRPASATVYLAGTSPAAGGLTFGNHLVPGDAHASVGGVGGNGISNAGDVLDGQRTYTYDLGGAADLADGIANRGDAGYAMLIWDMGLPLDSLRLYTHQDHYSGGPITDPFQAQDVMEYSVWGSSDGDNFVLLSDVTAFAIAGEGAGLPTYTFAGTAPTVVYRGGSAEFGALNAYTRDYTFSTAYQYYGVRTSSISLAAGDADPEIDAVAGYNAVPEPGTLALLGVGLLGLKARRRRQI